MKKGIKQQPVKGNPFLQKLVIALTIYISSFWFTKIDFYPILLKGTTLLILMVPLCWKRIKNRQKVEKKREEVIVSLAIFSCFFLGKMEDAILAAFLYQIVDYMEKKKENLESEKRKVWVEENTKRKQKDIEKIKVGDVLLLRNGELTLMDGILKTSKAYFNNEKGKRVLKKQGEQIPAGFLCQKEDVTLEVTKIYQETKLYEKRKYNEEIEKDQSNQETAFQKELAFYQQIATFLLGILAFTFIFLLGDVQIEAIYRSFLLLTIVNTIPYAPYVSKILQKGIRKLQENKVLIAKKNSFFLLPKVKNYIFEKTGTVTIGDFRITEVETNQEQELFYYLNYGEYFSHHPIALAVRKYHEIPVEEKKIKKYHFHENRGISYEIDKKKVLIGNSYFMKENKVEYEKNLNIGTIIYVAVDKTCIGSIVISDGVKYSTKAVIKELMKRKVQYTVILSSDNERIVNAVASELKVKDHYSNLKEEEKKFWILHLKENHPGKFAMVGSKDTKKELYDAADLGITLVPKDEKKQNKGDISLLENDLTKLIPAIEITESYTNKLRNFKILAHLIEALMLVLAGYGYISLGIIILLRKLCPMWIDKKGERENDRY